MGEKPGQVEKLLGPDGYGPEFCKIFQDSLKGPLLNMYLPSVEEGSLTCSLYLANLSLTLKKDKQILTNAAPIVPLTEQM